MKSVVIGGGIVGLLCAYELVRRGRRVVVVDAGPEGGSQCSTGNAGMIVPSHFTPLAAPGMVRYGLKLLLNPSSPFGFAFPPTLEQLAWAAKFMHKCTREHVQRATPVLRDLGLESRRIYQRIFAELGLESQLQLQGLNLFCTTAAAFEHEKETAQRAAQLGLRVGVLEGPALRQAEPLIQNQVVGAVEYLDDGWFSPTTLLNTLRSSLRASGTEFFYGARVKSVDVDGGAVQRVLTENGEAFEGQEFVLAAGVWSKDLARQLGVRLPIMAGKGYSFDVVGCQEPRRCALLIEARVAVTPMNGAVRFGGTMEIGPPNTNINQNRLRGIAQAVPEYFDLPEPVPTLESVWHGHRPCSPDGLPYIGRVPSLSNWIVATGHAMMGVSLAAITGSLVGQLADGETPDLPLDMLRPQRYD